MGDWGGGGGESSGRNCETNLYDRTRRTIIICPPKSYKEIANEKMVLAKIGLENQIYRGIILSLPPPPPSQNRP